MERRMSVTVNLMDMAPSLASSSPLPLQMDHQDQEEEVETTEAAAYYPSAPSSELFEMTTTVDPSYIISLIRKLLPHNVNNNHPFSPEEDHNSCVQELETGLGDKIMSPIPSPCSPGFTNNTVEAMDTLDETHEQKDIIQDSTTGDNAISTADEATWEECGCILWDLAVNKSHAVFMVENLLLEVLLASLTISPSVRVTEISLGILANIACHEILRNRMVTMPGLIDAVVDPLFLDDSLCLCETFWLLALGLQGSGSVTWAKALQPEHILRRILWVAENTLNSQLLEKSTGLLLAIVDSQQEVSQILLPHMMEFGLPKLLVSLLACEMKHLSGERVPDRYSVLDNILRVIEALSVFDNYSKVISSNKELLQLIYDLVKLPDKIEVYSSCVTAVVLIANILTDEPYLASNVSQDLPLLQGLLGLLPFVSNDLEARNALWSVLGRVLVRVQVDKMSLSSLHQFVMLLVSKSDFIEDDLFDHHVEDSNENTANASSTNATATSTSLSRICSILERWTAISGNMRKNDTVGEDCADDESVGKLLQCCHKYIS